MQTFRVIMFSSVLTGVIAGIVMSLVYSLTTEPLILHAETYEQSASPAEHIPHGTGDKTTDFSIGAALVDDHAAVHDHGEVWTPADGFERTLYTVAANVLTSIGYALVLNGLLAILAPRAGWREGLLWGFAGFATVMLAPGLGLHPELPGTPAAPVLARQAWWIGTAAATAAGIYLLAFRREAWAAVIAIALIVAPHIIGAPQPAAGEPRPSA